MLAILNSLNAHNLPIFQQILIILVSNFMVHRVLSDKIYLLLGLLSPLIPTRFAFHSLKTFLRSTLQGIKLSRDCDFQQCGLLTSVDSYEPLQPPFKLRNSKCCSANS